MPRPTVGSASGGRLRASRYSLESRSERLIAAGRVVLAASSLIAIWLDPSQPLRHVSAVYATLAGYLAYAIAAALVVWRSPVVPARLPIVTHALDLAIFPLLMYLTEGPGSPFFVYFVFSMLCATMRWQWAGTFWTAGIQLSILLVMGAYAANVLHEPGFELSTFVIRSVFLGVVGALLGPLGAYGQRLRREMLLLAAWPRVAASSTFDPHAPAREALEHAAAVLGAPRVVAVWEEADEPWVHVAWWSHGEFRRTRERPDAWSPLVTSPLAGSFLCADAAAGSPTVVHGSPGGLQRWQGAPLPPDFQARFRVGPVFSSALRGQLLEGRLFWLDKARMTSDDLVLGEIVARQVAARLDHFCLLQRLRELAGAEERVRLARDLHDGLLQSLTGAGLQLQAASGLLAEEPEQARARLVEIQRMIAAEQRDLRLFIEDLKPPTLAVPSEGIPWGDRLAEVVHRVEQQWGLEVQTTVADLEAFPERLAPQALLMLHEALVNAARHGRASVARVEVGVADGRLRMTIADNGRGFPFRGRYDHARRAAATGERPCGRSGSTGRTSSSSTSGCLRRTASPSSGRSGTRAWPRARSS